MDKIIAPPSGAKAAIASYATAVGARGDVAAFLDELWRLAPATGIDPFGVAVQSAHETDFWRSDDWVERRNPGGLGITSGPAGEDQHDLGYAWADGAEAAKAMLLHECAYLGVLPDALAPHLALDPRYELANRLHGGSVDSFFDYGSGRWAADPLYADKLRRRNDDALEYWQAHKGDDVSFVYENYVPRELWTPTPADRYVDRRKGSYQGSPQLIVIHIQDGTNSGSLQHFNQPNVYASATVMIARNGEIWRCIRDEDGPWTNGDVQSPTARGLAAVAVSPDGDPNPFSLTVELEGYSYAPNAMGWGAYEFPQAQLDALVWQVVTWMRKYGITVEMIFRHADINSRTRAACPGTWVYNYVVNAIRGTTMPDQTPTYVAPSPPPTFDGRNKSVNDVVFYAEKRTVYSATNGLNCRLWATTDAPLTRSPLWEGAGFGVVYWVRGEGIDGEDRWWVTKAGSRIWCGGTVQKPRDQEIQPSPAPPTGVVVRNGIEFYTVGGGEGIEVRSAVDGLRVREYATIDAAELRAPLAKGEKFRAMEWVRGERVGDEDRWWVTDFGSRIWVGGTVQKP